LQQTYGEKITAAMRALKTAADPQGLLNPHKMFDAPPMDSHLRFGHGYQTNAWSPAEDFTPNGGLSVAIEQCNGQGVCRKDTGVMCPSFQATREEKHSTRGRANLLRALISSRSVDPKHVDRYKNISQDVFEALDLCLACKGCKAECPSGVDMAKLKFAFLAEYYKTHHRLFRDYVFGYFHLTAGFLSSIAPLVNFATRIPTVRRLASKFVNISPQRPFPRFSRDHAQVKQLSGKRRVFYLSDPFTHYIEPKVEQAAFDLLFEAGFDVQVLSVIGGGASLLSKGFILEAKRHAGRVLNELIERDPQGLLPIVGVEPSEIYAVKNDYSDLVPEYRSELSLRKNKIWLLEEFLIRYGKLNDMRVATKNIEVKLHTHCHQKAESLAEDGLPNGTNASMEFLRSVGYKVELIDAGCCGMAGTFGYEAEHYELSQQIGDLKLFPYIKKEKGKALFAATGAACRMQINQGTGEAVEHPLILASNALFGHG
jgi:Fe-S oxidoreductase